MNGSVWEAEISINGTRTIETVVAFSSIDAKRLIEARYPGADIIWWYGPVEKR